MDMGNIIILSALIAAASCSTHWVVTEEGKVQERLESPFAINQPHDLVAFMKQEKHHSEMKQMKEMLIKEKNAIEENEDKDFDLESRHYRQDEDCKLAGKPLADFDLYVSSLLPLENKDIQVSDYIDTHNTESEVELHAPDCANMCDLPLGVQLYDDLEGVASGKHLHYLPETGLRATLKYMKTEKELANAIDDALKKNSSSWVAYNLATFYWRMKGEPAQALECVRRALHFSPTQYKDVALVNLANILHRSHYSLNASVVMLEALEISTHFNVNHFTLASIYAALGRYNESISYFTKTIATQPDFEAAKSRLHAVKCQYKLQMKLEAQHESLERTLRELEAYQEKHKKYMELYLSIEKMQQSRQDQVNLHFLLMQHLIKHGMFDHKLCKFRSSGDGPVVYCDLPKPSTEYVDILLSDADERGHIVDAKPTTYASGAESGTFEAVGDSSKLDYSFWKDSEWPSDKQCAEFAPRTLAWDEYPSSFIDLENRGFQVQSLLNDYIGMTEGEDAPKPWTELNCEVLEPITMKSTLDKIPGVINRHSAPMHKQDHYMKREILIHINEGRDWPGDLGHRLHAAITKSLRNKDKSKNLWLLYNYAGLFFRVQGDNLKAVECIRRAAYHAPEEHYDSALVNMANIMYRLGKVNDALTLLIEALGVNNTEPVSYLAVGNALQANGNSTGAMTFYEYALMLHPNYSEALYALINVKCAARRDKNLLNQRKRMKYEEARAQEESSGEMVYGQSQLACDREDQLCEGQAVQTPHDHAGATGSMSGGSFEQASSDGAAVYTMSRYAAHESPTNAECENASSKRDLMQRLESKKEDADKVLDDADNVINMLSHIAKDNANELTLGVSSARQIMQRLSQMRDSLGMLVEEASSTLDVKRPEGYSLKKAFTEAECAEVLHAVDLRVYISTDMNALLHGYDFGEELNDVVDNSFEGTEPHCTVPSTSSPYNFHHLDSVMKSDGSFEYDSEYGMKTLLQQLFPDRDPGDFEMFVSRLSQGMTLHPRSWRLAFLSSLYWRFRGKADEAINCLRLGLHYSPTDMRSVLLVGLADVSAQLAWWNDAISVAEQALGLNPEYFLHHVTLANIRAAMGDVRESIPHFKRAIELQPGSEIDKRRFEAAVCEQQRYGIH